MTTDRLKHAAKAALYLWPLGLIRVYALMAAAFVIEDPQMPGWVKGISAVVGGLSFFIGATCLFAPLHFLLDEPANIVQGVRQFFGLPPR